MLLEFFVTVFLLFILVILFIKPSNAYSGTYRCEKNTNESLILNADNSFKIVSVLDKDDVVFSGKYRISHNHIHLSFDDKGTDEYFKNMSDGEVDGSVIIFSELRGTSVKFNKL